MGRRSNHTPSSTPTASIAVTADEKQKPDTNYDIDVEVESDSSDSEPVLQGPEFERMTKGGHDETSIRNTLPPVQGAGSVTADQVRRVLDLQQNSSSSSFAHGENENDNQISEEASPNSSHKLIIAGYETTLTGQGSRRGREITENAEMVPPSETLELAADVCNSQNPVLFVNALGAIHNYERLALFRKRFFYDPVFARAYISTAHKLRSNEYSTYAEIYNEILANNAYRSGTYERKNVMSVLNVDPTADQATKLLSFSFRHELRKIEAGTLSLSVLVDNDKAPEMANFVELGPGGGELLSIISHLYSLAVKYRYQIEIQNKAAKKKRPYRYIMDRNISEEMRDIWDDHNSRRNKPIIAVDCSAQVYSVVGPDNPLVEGVKADLEFPAKEETALRNVKDIKYYYQVLRQHGVEQHTADVIFNSLILDRVDIYRWLEKIYFHSRVNKKEPNKPYTPTRLFIAQSFPFERKTDHLSKQPGLFKIRNWTRPYYDDMGRLIMDPRELWCKPEFLSREEIDRLSNKEQKLYREMQHKFQIDRKLVHLPEQEQYKAQSIVNCIRQLAQYGIHVYNVAEQPYETYDPGCIFEPEEVMRKIYPEYKNYRSRDEKLNSILEKVYNGTYNKPENTIAIPQEYTITMMGAYVDSDQLGKIVHALWGQQYERITDYPKADR
ncbi:hypothetical protein GF340_00125 [Candidatus Peregrinibacteria bacterium]|nr:hypothetical protein [Candidatus Peregrinibacteria bacterium]